MKLVGTECLPLFDPPLPPPRATRSAPATSHEAAVAIAPRQATLAARALDVIRRAGVVGRTADEVEEEMGESVLATRPRVTELHQAGYIWAPGDKRRNASGLRVMVWVAT